jgi:hypothetical protein
MKSPKEEDLIYSSEDMKSAQGTSLLLGIVLGATLMAMIAALAISIALQ